MEYKGNKVRIVKQLRHKSAWVKGKEVAGAAIVDQEGTWVQIQILDGPNKGNRMPVVKEKLT